MMNKISIKKIIRVNITDFFPFTPFTSGSNRAQHYSLAATNYFITKQYPP